MKNRLFIGIWILLGGFLAAALLGVLHLSRIESNMERLVLFHRVEVVRESLIVHLQQVQSHISRARTRSGADIDLLISQFEEVDKSMNSCTGCHHSPELTQGLRTMRDMTTDYKAAISGLVTASANPDRIAMLERRTADIGRELMVLVQGMAFTANVRLQGDMKKAVIGVHSAKWALIFVMFAGALTAFLILWTIKKKYSTSIRRFLVALEAIGSGRSEALVPAESVFQECSELEEALNRLTGRLRTSLRQRIHRARLSAVSDLAASIAYEVNNPLTTVLGYTSLLGKADDIPESRKNQLKTIEQETIRAREMLGKMLVFSRRRPPVLTDTGLHSLIDSAIEDVRRRKGDKGMLIQRTGDCAIVLPADAPELKTALMNLIENAFLAMPDGGTLEVRCLQRAGESGGKTAAIEIIDSGAGIDEEHMEIIFDPFYTTRKEGEGTGLGLPVSFLIVQSHGGRIEVESNAGKGSCFRVILPAERSGIAGSKQKNS